MICELRGCGNRQSWGISWESAGSGERMWFRFCVEHAEAHYLVHRLEGWYRIRLAETVEELLAEVGE